jgi:HSP20 family protein
MPARHRFLDLNAFGRTSGGFLLVHEIDAKAVIAKLEDGVLKLTLAKSQQSGARPIAIE